MKKLNPTTIAMLVVMVIVLGGIAIILSAGNQPATESITEEPLTQPANAEANSEVNDDTSAAPLDYQSEVIYLTPEGDSVGDTSGLAPTPIPAGGESFGSAAANEGGGSGDSGSGEPANTQRVNNTVNTTTNQQPQVTIRDASPTPAAPPDMCTVSTLDLSPINIRANAGTEYAVVGTLYPGTYLRLWMPNNNGWYGVIVHTGGIGWVSSTVAQLHGPCSQPPRMCEVRSATGNPFIVYGQPDFSASRDASMPGNIVIVANARTNTNWTRVVYNSSGAFGWVNNADVSLSGQGCGGLPVIDAPVVRATATPSPMPAGNCTLTTPYSSWNLYGSPSFDSALIDIVPGTTTFEATQRSDNGWYSVRHNGQMVWIHNEVVTANGSGCNTLPIFRVVPPTPTPLPANICRVTIIVDSIPLRAGPSTNDRAFDTVTAGSSGPAWARANNGWIQFVAENINKVGWVPPEAISTSGNCDALPLPTAPPVPVTEEPPSCSIPFFFTPVHSEVLGRCPAGAPTSTQALYQPFQNGYMIWRADNNLISAVLPNGWPVTFTNEGEITIDEAMPEGFYAPMGVFTAIWANYPDIRNGLGYATATATSYTMTVQTLDNPFTMFITLPGTSRVMAHLTDRSYVAGNQ